MIAYSCFSSAYFCALKSLKTTKFSPKLNTSSSFRFICRQSYSLTLPDGEGIKMKKIKLTRQLQKNYVKSGWFFFDFIATTPFYLNTDTGNNAIWLKLLRMIRVPRVIGLFDVTHFNKIMEKLISGQPRSKQVYLGLVFKTCTKYAVSSCSNSLSFTTSAASTISFLIYRFCTT